MFLVMAPACFGMAALAEPLTSVFLGKEWGMVKDIVGVSAMSALIWGVSELHMAIFSVKNAMRFMLIWSLFLLVGTAVVLILAVPYGLVALVWARLGWDVFTGLLYSWFLARLIRTSLPELLLPLARPLLVAMLMAALVAWLDGRLGGVGLVPIARLAVGTVFGVLVYGATMLLVDRTRVLQLVDRVRNRRAAPPAG
jgi:succinoglycan exporter